MSTSTFPVAPDARGPRVFSIIRGVDTMIREDFVVDPSVVALIDQGEWVTFNGAGNVIKASGQNAGAPMSPAKVNWTLYKQGDVWNGQSDAAALGHITCPGGAYVAQTQHYITGATYHIGDILVAIDDGAGNGVLTPIVPSAATATQLASAVGKVHALPVNGVLTFEHMA
jgi:hypothetical protein